MSATPTITRRTVLEIKYGNTMSTRPQTNGTTAFCFLPYMKKPRPMEPKSSPQTRDDVLKASARVGRGPWAAIAQGQWPRLPGLVQDVSVHARGLRPRRACLRLALPAQTVLPSECQERVGTQQVL